MVNSKPFTLTVADYDIPSVPVRSLIALKTTAENTYPTIRDVYTAVVSQLQPRNVMWIEDDLSDTPPHVLLATMLKDNPSITRIVHTDLYGHLIRIAAYKASESCPPHDAISPTNDRAYDLARAFKEVIEEANLIGIVGWAVPEQAPVTITVGGATETFSPVRFCHAEVMFDKIVYPNDDGDDADEGPIRTAILAQLYADEAEEELEDSVVIPRGSKLAFPYKGMNRHLDDRNKVAVISLIASRDIRESELASIEKEVKFSEEPTQDFLEEYLVSSHYALKTYPQFINSHAVIFDVSDKFDMAIVSDEVIASSPLENIIFVHGSYLSLRGALPAAVVIADIPESVLTFLIDLFPGSFDILIQKLERAGFVSTYIADDLVNEVETIFEYKDLEIVSFRNSLKS